MATLKSEVGSRERQPLLANPPLDEPLKGLAIASASFACVSGLTLGYDVAVTNGALLPIRNYFHLDHRRMELFVGTLNLMALPGCLCAGYIADWFGRRGAIGIGSVLFFVGNALMAFAFSYIGLLVGRAFAGFSVGLTLVIAPLYTAETSPARLRGMLSTNVEVSFNVGMVLGFVTAWLYRDFPDETSWRWMIGLCLVAPVLSLIGVLFVLPESPRWLSAQGRLEEASDVIQKLVGPIEAKNAMEAMTKRTYEQPEMTWKEMLTTKQTVWLLFIGGGVAFFSQSTGIESLVYYTGIILEEAGMSRHEMLLATMIMGLFKLLAIFAQGLVVDRIGRRPCLLVSGLGMAASMCTLGLSFTLSWGWKWKVVPIIIFVVVFSLGYGPIVYTLNAEIFPSRCRSRGLSFAMGVGRVTSAVVALSFLSLSSCVTTGGTFMLYTLSGVVAFAFVLFAVPETKGTSLDAEEGIAMGWQKGRSSKGAA